MLVIIGLPALGAAMIVGLPALGTAMSRNGTHLRAEVVSDVLECSCLDRVVRRCRDSIFHIFNMKKDMVQGDRVSLFNKSP